MIRVYVCFKYRTQSAVTFETYTCNKYFKRMLVLSPNGLYRSVTADSREKPAVLPPRSNAHFGIRDAHE